MVQFIGQEFEGTISGVSSFGFFVALENGVEGLVHISSLTDDYYEFVEGQYALLGQHLGHRYRLGDPVKIQVYQVNVPERKIDFILAGMKQQPAAQGKEDNNRRNGSQSFRSGKKAHKKDGGHKGGREKDRKKRFHDDKRRRRDKHGKNSEGHSRKQKGKARL